MQLCKMILGRKWELAQSQNSRTKNLDVVMIKLNLYIKIQGLHLELKILTQTWVYECETSF